MSDNTAPEKATRFEVMTPAPTPVYTRWNDAVREASRTRSTIVDATPGRPRVTLADYTGTPIPEPAEHPEDCAACAAGEPQVHAYEAPETVAPGAYGIEAVDPSTPGAMVCGECGRAWADDITPAGRCPWEADHLDPDAEENDFCYECNRVTRWEGERCAGCGREWGHPLPKTGDDDSGRREYRFTVTITADSADAAGRIIAERLAYDEEYDFPGGSDYEIGYAEEVAQ